jgi:hypothetical protein
MRNRNVRAPDPSPAQIAAMTAKIQLTWDKKEIYKRGGPAPYSAAVIAPAALSLTRPLVRLHD